MTNETIDLMLKHASVRNFTDEKIPSETLKMLIDAGRAASSWKNFQSYSIINVTSDETKQKIFDLQPQKSILGAANFLVFVGDLNRAEKAVKLHTTDFYPTGVENLLITSVDASLAAQNTLLAAESLGYGGVIVGLVREQSAEISQILNLPDYTYPLFGLALGVPSRHNDVKPRLPYETVVFDESYQVQDDEIIKTYDQVQQDYAGERRVGSDWSDRVAAQFGAEPQTATLATLRDKKLMRQHRK
ncbi:NADPH-dependent oxidoreductase [Lactococcus hodotermopsidis]|uniref:NADPH-dependent oxidoreductase n=1 Tax=Pseudolactococcus hodotermopsidis TaxID=2709157 RepID=A0A6A0BGR8_9LACT|nr:nitroreductase family protein [Lactococcus hodotermopsidis]GFH42977.1 NADPH-dependent oxidoreductase [Lactococcus hodotermopsidis]